MQIAPFTKSDAYSIAKQFQHLVGRQYKTKEDDKAIYTILHVLPTPFSKRKQIEFSQLYILYINGDGLLQNAFNYLKLNEDNEFDVLLISSTPGDYKLDLSTKPISIISENDELKHGFDILLVS